VRRVVAAALTAAALLAGCGGGDDGPKVVTKDSFISEGDLVCASLAERFADAGATDPKSSKDIADSARVLADNYGDLLEGLRDLDLPTAAADRRGAAAYVAAVQRTEGLLGDLRTSSKAFQASTAGTDVAKVQEAGNEVRQALDAFRAGQASANRRAVTYGFNLCGNLG
jgi:hypothetical protein